MSLGGALGLNSCEMERVISEKEVLRIVAGVEGVCGAELIVVAQILFISGNNGETGK